MWGHRPADLAAGPAEAGSVELLRDPEERPHLRDKAEPPAGVAVLAGRAEEAELRD